MKDVIDKALFSLNEGGILLYPTDTVYGIGCDATNYEAVKKIYTLKQRDDSKSMICLVSDFNMLQQYIEHVPEVVYTILKDTSKPTTIIYDNPLHVAKNLIAEDNTLAIRVVSKGFAFDLINTLKKPLVSTSANISGKPTPKSFKEIDQAILKGVDYVVNLPNETKNAKPSTIIKVSGQGIVKVIRK